MKILITGGAGFVCSHLADKLYEKGHSLILLDNLLTGNVKNIEHLLSNDNVDFMEHDVQNHIEISDDVDFIFQRITNKSMPDSSLMSIFDYMFELLSKIHSEARDADLEEYLKEMHNNPVNLPNVLFKIIDCMIVQRVLIIQGPFFCHQLCLSIERTLSNPSYPLVRRKCPESFTLITQVEA